MSKNPEGSVTVVIGVLALVAASSCLMYKVCGLAALVAYVLFLTLITVISTPKVE